MDLFLNIKEEVKKFIKIKDKILICVSGGPDSVVLFHIINRLKKEFNLQIFIAHFNHKLRGKDSEKDALFVKQLAKEYKNKFVYSSKNIKELSKKKNFGPEKTAREERYKFFIKTAIKYKINKILLAHNMDDNVETILFRFIKGAGTEGLIGIPEIRKVNYGDFGLQLNNLKKSKIFIIRPLLKVSRKEIMQYIKINNLKYRIDKTNEQNIFVRNKIRNFLIPLIEKNFNLSFKSTVSNISKILYYDNDFLEMICNKFMTEIIIKKSKNKVIISLKKYKKLHPAIRLRCIRNILKEIIKKHRIITFTLINSTDNSILNNRRIDLPLKYKCYINDDKIIISA
jgi:tRNA(Ile)-lysidine synthase